MAIDERRLVAERLRGLDYSDLQESLICAYLDALGIKGYEDWIGIANRLADLIEPSDHIGDSDKMVDREALLALADEMTVEKGDIWRWSRRIREACGEVVE